MAETVPDPLMPAPMPMPRPRRGMLVLLMLMLLGAGPAVRADETYAYPPDHQQADPCYVWAWDDDGGLLLWNRGCDGPLTFGWRGGGDVAWQQTLGSAPHTYGKHHGYLAEFEFEMAEDGSLLVHVRDVAIEPSGEPETPGDGTGEPWPCPAC